MASELEELAKKREEMLFKESEVNYIFKKEKPVIQLGDFITSVAPGASKEKRFRVRALLKGKISTLFRKERVYPRIPVKEERNLPVQDEHQHQERTDHQIRRRHQG